MAKKVKIDNLASEISKVMKDFANATEESVDEAIKTTSQSALRELKKSNPPGSGEYGSWNNYNKSWKVMQTKADKRYHRKAVIHNEKYYRLTHLLEKGHALVNGGRTRAFPHILPIAKKAEEELIENIKKGI